MFNWYCRIPCPGVKQPERVAHSSLHPSPGLGMSGAIPLFTPPIRLYGVDKNNFTFFVYLLPMRATRPPHLLCYCDKSYIIFFFFGAATQRGSWPPHSWGFLDHTQRRTTVGRTLLDEWSARRRDHYLTTHNTHNRQTSMPQVGFEPTISAGERPQTYVLDRAATGTGTWIVTAAKIDRNSSGSQPLQFVAQIIF